MLLKCFIFSDTSLITNIRYSKSHDIIVNSNSNTSFDLLLRKP